VFRELSDADLRSLHELLARRDSTIDVAHEWLLDRGYEISRSAVGRYSRAWRHRGGRLAQLLAVATAPAARKRITWLMRRLTDEKVISLAVFAVMLWVQQGPPETRKTGRRRRR
jgi:hypothetical protein